MGVGIAPQTAAEPMADDATRAPGGPRAARVLELCTLGMLAVFMLAAPHSIAITQGAFIAGMIFWLLRCIASRSWLVAHTPVDVPLLVFVGLTLLATVFGEAPEHGVGRLRGVALFLILYLFASNVRGPRVAWGLTLLLVFSAVFNLGLTYMERAEGRGLKIQAMSPESPLRKWGLQEGDTILTAGGAPIGSLDEFNALFDDGAQREKLEISYLRQEGVYSYAFRKKAVRKLGTEASRLGVALAPGRDFRAQGFFSHPVTYSEVMLLVGAVAAGWAIAAGRRHWRWIVGMGAIAAAIAGAIVMTATRASIVSFAVACVAMVVLRGARKRFILTAAVAGVLLVAAAGAFVLQGRRVGYIDPNDQSTTWRLTVWREGLGLIADHPLLGIGPDAAKVKYKEWGLFEGGKLPPGHWHSTPIQIAVDRGIPALLAFVAVFGIFFVSAGRHVRRLARSENDGGDWRLTAAALGAWGAALGAILSSFVHFNIGDSEVVQILWALMGIAFALQALDDASRRTGDELPDAG